MKYITYPIIVFLIIITIFNFNIIIDSINLSFNTCINILIPSIIPFLLISTIVIKRNKQFNIYTLYLLCLISGSPSNAKYIKDYIDSGSIDTTVAQNLLNYLQFVNPIYILNGIGLVILNDKRLGLIIFISNLISSYILHFFNKNIYIKNSVHNKNTLFYDISTTIKETISTILYIIGVITSFFIITSYIDIFLNLKAEYKFIYGIFEITQGINYLNSSNLNAYYKMIISCFFISFGGLSIHMQIFGLLDNKKIRYKPYLINRIMHSLLSIQIANILYYFYIKIFTWI